MPTEKARRGDEQQIYQITIGGRLDPGWSEWFDGLALEPLNGDQTVLTGPIVDQPALYGLLKKIRDLGLPLLSVRIVEPEEFAKSQDHEPS